jgi:hypothetical protein
MTCQRIEGSEASSHRTTRPLDFWVSTWDVLLSIRRILLAMVEERCWQSDHLLRYPPCCSRAPTRQAYPEVDPSLDSV